MLQLCKSNSPNLSISYSSVTIYRHVISSTNVLLCGFVRLQVNLKEAIPTSVSARCLAIQNLSDLLSDLFYLLMNSIIYFILNQYGSDWECSKIYCLQKNFSFSLYYRFIFCYCCFLIFNVISSIEMEFKFYSYT